MCAVTTRLDNGEWFIVEVLENENDKTKDTGQDT